MSWVYSDYIEVRKDFIPVFSEEADRINPDAWKSFIPHRGFEDVIQTLSKALERGKAEDRRSLWMRGAYGTGKTYASFVIKHLLEDSAEQIKDYFTGSSSHKMQMIWKQFSSIRERGTILVPYLSSSAHINTTFRFLAELQRAIKNTLAEKGMLTGNTESIQEKMLNKLTDELGTFSWPNAFNKYRNDFPQFANAAEVVEAIRNGDSSVAETVLEILEREDIVIPTSPQEVKDWIEAVIEVNGIKAIVVIWDEFTDFFANTEQVSGLQEIAHLTTSSPFYLFLITHKALGQFKKIDDQSKKKILERFHDCYFDMNDLTAFHLIAHALRAKPEMGNDWSVIRDDLWSRIKALTSFTPLRDKEWKAEQFRLLTPIHPFSAHALARISTQFSSSQRTLFKFLESADNGSFKDFLAGYPKEEDYWFTPDRLWDYFFTSEDSDLADNVRNIVHHFTSSATRIEEPTDLRVFKAIMLFMSVWRQTQDKLLKATSINLRLAFYGALDPAQIEKSTSFLARNEIIRQVRFGHDEWEFFVWEKNIDDEKIEAIRRKYFPDTAFEANARHDNLGKSGYLGTIVHTHFNPNTLATYRQIRCTISSSEFQRLRAKAAPQKIKPYQFGSVFIIPLDDSELHLAKKLAEQLAGESVDSAYFVVNTPFTETRWNGWVGQRVYQFYYREEGDQKNADFHNRQAENHETEWMKQVAVASLTAYFQGSRTEIKDFQGYENFLSKIVKQMFPYGPETLDVTATLYKESGWAKNAVEQGLGLQKKGQYSVLNKVFEDFEKKGGSASPSTKTLSELDNQLNRQFERSGQLNINEFWQIAQSSPYGFLPSAVSAAIMGFTFKHFARGHYWSDGLNCHHLSGDKMAELIEAVMKGKVKADTYEIRKMSPYEEQLCAFLMQVFGLDADRAKYPAEARKALRTKLQEIGFPLWSLQHVNLDADQKTQDLRDALVRLNFFISSDADSEVDGWSSQLKDLHKSMGNCLQILTSIASKRYFEKGMKGFLEQSHPGLIELAGNIEWDFTHLINRIKESMNEAVWLWKRDLVQDKLPEIYSELMCLQAVNLLCSKQNQTIDEAIKYYQSKWLPARTSLPLRIFLENADNEVRETVNGLHELIGDESRRYIGQENLYRNLLKHKGVIRDLFENQDFVLSSWVKKTLKKDLSLKEAAELKKGLSGISVHSTIEAFKEEIENAIYSIERQRLSRQIRDEWLKITESPCPSKWSEKNSIPISWVLHGADYAKMFGVVEESQKRSRPELEEALELMREKESSLKMLGNRALHRSYFLDNAAPEYKDLINSEGAFERFREHLKKEMKWPIHEWPLYGNAARLITRKWVEDTYKCDAYSHVVKKIEEMPEVQAKSLLRDLAEDPMTGFRILKYTKGVD